MYNCCNLTFKLCSIPFIHIYTYTFYYDYPLKSILTRDEHADTLTNEDLQYAGITPLQACIRTTEKHDHSVDDDLFDLGLGCQMDYNGWLGGIELRTIDLRIYALTIDSISRNS
ncbi:hypothetical protein U3516DRAFT_825656 [Neocallimastix sp. 'constans']